MTVERDESEFKRFLDAYIYGTKDFMEYLQKCGGLERMRELRRQEFLLGK
jgi:hypothetical protein